MKSTILTLITSLILLIPASGQGQWQIVNEGFPSFTGSVDFINDDIGWIAGNNGISQTTNGSKSWTLLNDTILFRDIDFIDEMTGWAVADGNLILKTRDGGQTWNYSKQFEETTNGVQLVNDSTLVVFGDTILIRDYLKQFEETLNELQVVDDSTILVSGDSILIKWNNGPDWEVITPSLGTHFSSAVFINSDTGIAIGNNRVIYRTFNGGTTWNKDEIPDFSSIYDVHFTNDSTFYFLAMKWNDTVNHHICKTTDFFNTWTIQSTTELTIHSCHFFEDDVIVGLFYQIEEPGGGTIREQLRMMKSHDGGSSWKNIDSFAQLHYWRWSHLLFNLYFTENSGYFFLTGDFILKSNDQGNNWTCVNILEDLPDVDFIDRNKGFILGGFNWIHGGNGLLFKTEDGGKTWNHIYQESTGFTSLKFINESKGFITTYVKYPRRLLTSSDGGYSWIVDSTFNSAREIFFLNDTIGWVFAIPDSSNIWNRNYLFQTKNQGKDWEIFPAFDSTEEWPSIYSSCFINEKMGWVVGTLQDGSYPDNYKNLLLKYTEEDGWVSIDPGTDLPLNKISFFDHDHGWIAGGFGSQSWDDEFIPLFLRSVDGGKNWDQITGLDYVINDFYFENRDHGWAVGEDAEERGVILETFNGGLNWVAVKNRLSAPLNSLDFADGYGWAVGENGLILNLGYPPMHETKDIASKFMVVADPHHYSPSTNLDQSMLYEFAMAAIEEKVDFMFIPGDLVIRRSEDPATGNSLLHDWQYILDTLAHHNIRLYACRGNNDTGSGPAWDSLFSGIYQFPQNGPEGEKNLTYAIEYDNLMFVSLDQYTDYQKINQVWLDDLLATTTSEHIFAAGHTPAFRVSNSCMSSFPENRNLLWESLTDAGVKAYFSGHDHFYDHTIINDGDGNPDNDIHQVITGTGGGSLHDDGEYNGDNGRWTPDRLFHEEENGYVLVEISGAEVEMKWKKRIGQHIFEDGGDSFIFSPGATNLQEIQPGTEYLVNYPNPFHSNTTITYQLSCFSDVELSVYDLTGRKVSALVQETQQSGSHEVEWNAGEMQPGIYICELRTGQTRQVMKMILID